MFHSLSASRMRIIALMIVAALSFSAAAAATVHMASPADAAKKKAKKCKKGYKKVKGKCKKKSKGRTVANPVTAIVLKDGRLTGKVLRVTGTYSTKSVWRGKKLFEISVVSAAGTQKISREITGAGRPVNPFSIAEPVTGSAPLTVTFTAEGVTSNTITVD